MRLKVSANTANEQLVALINKGYTDLEKILSAYHKLRRESTYNADRDNATFRAIANKWRAEVVDHLVATFPTKLEAFRFLRTEESVTGTHGMNAEFNGIKNRLDARIQMLNEIRQTSIKEYTDLPIETRLYVEHIDSFSKVRDINAAQVDDLLVNGYFNRSEEDVQKGLEIILTEKMHKKDWGGEINDLYSSNVIIQGGRIDGAFLLKGNGLRGVMEIGDCGKNGDQILRLTRSPARLLVVQYVGNISEAVIEDATGKARDLSNQRGESVHCCIINGQDTARLFRAYGLA